MGCNCFESVKGEGERLKKLLHKMSQLSAKRSGGGGGGGHLRWTDIPRGE